MMTDYTLITGGAEGSDLYWQKRALERNVNVHIMTFRGHKPCTSEGNPTSILNPLIHKICLSDKELENAKVHAMKANERLKRRFPCNREFSTKLVSRNYFIVKDVEAVVAIAEVTDNLVEGGTGWATTMANNLGKDVYVYDVKSLRWYKYENEMLSPCECPRLPKTFAGVGSRSLCEEGKRAIDCVLKSID